MSWKFFGGATILAVGLLLKAGAPLLPVVAGVGLAAVFNGIRLRATAVPKGRRPPQPGA